MGSYGFTPDYLTKDGKAWFPVMGEIHYSRYPEAYWKESLYKMKAGGVDVVSTYVIWIHHEEVEGVRDFSGNRNLRAFVETCAECGLKLMLRIGPWSHGEVRNGGFPDWLFKKEFNVRTNESGYFAEVEKFYRMIYSQVDGLLFENDSEKNNGPIIGVQIENEYGHCGGLSGEEGERHMRTLAAMARDIGFRVPLWTATGWGGAVTGGLVPVMGGYCEAPWDQRLTDIEPSGNYIFTHERNDHNIGSDYGFGTGITFDLEKFPFLTAELGGGLQVTEHRRPVATAADIGAMSLVKLGSGVNLLGYYMYHGGTNPEGKLTTLQETKTSGSINNLPELSYDFRAPIREYGQLSDTYRELKLLTLFIKDFGSGLCETKAYIPSSNPLFPADATGVRHSFRYAGPDRPDSPDRSDSPDGQSGYLFVNNYQRRQTQASHANVTFVTPTGVAFPPVDIADRDYFFLPFNMSVGNAILESALVTPLCVLHGMRGNPPVYVFYAAFAYAEKLLATGDVESLYRFKDGKKPDNVEIRTLSRRDALDAWKVGEELIIEREELLVEGDVVSVLHRTEGRDVTVSPASLTTEKATYALSVPAWKAEDCFLRIDYEGFTACLYETGPSGDRGKLIADNFFIGPDYSWEIGLKRFGIGIAREFLLEITPLSRSTPVFLEKWPEMEKGIACRLIRATTSLQVRMAHLP
jgi:hypothetical protein